MLRSAAWQQRTQIMSSNFRIKLCLIVMCICILHAANTTTVTIMCTSYSPPLHFPCLPLSLFSLTNILPMTCHARSSPKINSQCAISATRSRTGNTNEPFSPGASLRELPVCPCTCTYVRRSWRRDQRSPASRPAGQHAPTSASALASKKRRSTQVRESKAKQSTAHSIPPPPASAETRPAR
jgi:hypothetical protein